MRFFTHALLVLALSAPAASAHPDGIVCGPPGDPFADACNAVVEPVCEPVFGGRWEEDPWTGYPWCNFHPEGKT